MKLKDSFYNLLSTFIILGFIIFVILFIVLFYFVKMVKPKDTNNTNYENVERIYNLDDISNIKFNFINTSISFYETEEPELKIVQTSVNDHFYYSKKKKKNTLTIKETNAGALLNLATSIYIPTSYKGEITIKNAFGNISFDNVSNLTTITNNSGSIVIIKGSSPMVISSVSGSVSIGDYSSTLNCNTSTGSIVIDKIDGILELESISGSINVNNFLVRGESNLKNISGSINLGIDNESKCMYNIISENGQKKINQDKCKDSINALNISNVTGIIEIK